MLTACNTVFRAEIRKTEEARLERAQLEGCLLAQQLEPKPIEYYAEEDQPREGDARTRFLGPYFQVSVWEHPNDWTVVFHPWQGGAGAAEKSLSRFEPCVRAIDADAQIKVSSEDFLDLR